MAPRAVLARWASALVSPPHNTLTTPFGPTQAGAPLVEPELLTGS